MHRKSLIILFIFLSILCLSTLCFASNMSNSVKNVTNGVVDGVVSFGEDVRNGVGYVENGIAGAIDMNVTRDDNNMMNGENNNNKTAQSATSTIDNAYDATRVATVGSTDTNTMWVWIALAVAAIIVVGVVWYYSTRDNM